MKIRHKIQRGGKNEGERDEAEESSHITIKETRDH